MRLPVGNYPLFGRIMTLYFITQLIVRLSFNIERVEI